MGESTTTTALAERVLDIIAEEDPLNDALDGYPHHHDRLADLSEVGQRALSGRAAAIAAAAQRGGDEAERVDRAVVAQQAQAVVTRLDARLVEHTMVGYDHSPLGRVLGALPQARPADPSQEHDFLSRLTAVPEFLSAAATRHRAGVASGRTPVAERAWHAVDRIDAYLSAPADDPLHLVRLSVPSATERDRLLTEAIRPALADYREVLRTEIAPYGRTADQPGLCWLPGGEQTYQALARMHTTTSHTPEQLHEMGTRLMRELDCEYTATGETAFGLRSADEVRNRLRSDPALRWRHPEELLTAARESVARAESVVLRWFDEAPTANCAVAAAPDPEGPSAFYLPPSLNGSRPGTYFVNIGQPAERSRFVAEVTAFHEAVPGHHLQLALAQRLTTLLPLRRFAWINSYIEGWGLYAERLADDMGLYSGPLARLGMLAMDSLRAARLVVDTGIHAFGWSTRRALEYLSAHTVLTDTEARGEIHRYTEFPGQALSYLVGRQEFLRLRERSMRELGDRFDIRGFHDLVLGGGPLPMAVLDTVVTRWSGNLRRAGASDLPRCR